MIIAPAKRDQAEKLGGGEADEQDGPAGCRGCRVAERALEERAEDVADADGPRADADRCETGTDDLLRKRNPFRNSWVRTLVKVDRVS
jgi:hypothetical protein